MKMSISQKLIILITGLFLLSSGTLILTSNYTSYHHLTNIAQHDFTVMSDFFSRQVGGLVRFKKEEDLKQAFNALREQSEQHLVAMEVTLSDGSSLLSLNLSDNPNLDLTPTSGKELSRAISYLKNDYAYVELPIVFGKKQTQVGQLLLIWSFDEVNSVMQSSLYLAAVVTAITLGLVITVLIFVVRWLVGTPMARVIRLSREIAQGDGDLTRRINYTSNDELGELSQLFNQVLENMHATVAGIHDSLANLLQMASSVDDSSQTTSSDVQKQRQSIEHLCAAMSTISDSVGQVANSAEQTSELSQHVDAGAQKGLQVVETNVHSIESLANEVEQAAQVIDELSQQSHQISSVLDVIRGIAEQTNLLALNAAIEAARAGDQGRGFAVVADEVRTLAEKTQSSTEEINQMIDGLQKRTQQAVAVMQSGVEQSKVSVQQAQESGQALEGIAGNISEISDKGLRIVDSSQTQSGIVAEISAEIEKLQQMTQHISEASQHSAELSHGLTELAQQMSQLLNKFRV